MIRFRSGLLLVLLSIVTAVISQNPDRKYLGLKDKKDHIEIATSDGIYVFRPYSESIMETAFVPKGEVFDTHSWAVVMKPEEVDTKLDETNNAVKYNTRGIEVTIDKSPFQISYSYAGRYLISEKEGYIKTDTTKEIAFNLRKDEVLYGGGERVLGMNHRGYRLQLYNRAHYGYTTHSELMNYCIPMVLSSDMYAIHFDNAPIGFLDLDSHHNNTLKYETIGGRMVYQVIAGDAWSQIMDAYTDLTGKQPLPPRWAFGNFSSRFGYHSEKQVRETVQKFIDDSIPLDAVVIDIYWFGPEIQGYMGNLKFWADSFPTPDRMMDEFKSKGIKTVLVSEPFILTTSDNWKEAVDDRILGTDSIGDPYTYDFYFGHTGLIDIFKPSAEAWFWNFYKSFTERGVGGWWGDLGEPEVHPPGLQHVVGSADEVHNVYGHEWTKLISEGYKKDFPDQRPFILMRAGAAGSQHYGIIPWTGDVDRSWGGLQPQPELSLQMGMQGIGYLHSDLGGFAGGEVFDPELYIRWLQYGVFQPIYRPHAQEHIPAEPVYHDAKTIKLAKQAIDLRYELLPYIYTIAYENSETGMPLMRPLFFQDPGNRKLLTMADNYLWGNDFLVSPVTHQGQKKKEVYFPSGSNWFDFNNDDEYEGGKTAKIKLEEDHIPVFVRGGAFIPMVDPVQNTELYSTKNLKLHYYNDPVLEISTSYMYDDDGKTPEAFGKRQYEILLFTAKCNNGQLQITLKDQPGTSYAAPDRSVELTLHNMQEKPESVFIDNQAVPFTYYDHEHRLELQVPWRTNRTVNVLVKISD